MAIPGLRILARKVNCRIIVNIVFIFGFIVQRDDARIVANVFLLSAENMFKYQ